VFVVGDGREAAVVELDMRKARWTPAEVANEMAFAEECGLCSDGDALLWSHGEVDGEGAVSAALLWNRCGERNRGL
jgi:hypothetical protein